MDVIFSDTRIVLGTVAARRTELATRLEEGAVTLNIHPESELDTAGAQLIVSAILTARDKNRPFQLRIPEGSAFASMWRSLALESLPETTFVATG